jgi:hypothetical protein
VKASMFLSTENALTICKFWVSRRASPFAAPLHALSGPGFLIAQPRPRTARGLAIFGPRSKSKSWWVPTSGRGLQIRLGLPGDSGVETELGFAALRIGIRIGPKLGIKGHIFNDLPDEIGRRDQICHWWPTPPL